VDEQVARPVLLGDPQRVKKLAEQYDLDLEGAEVIDPASSPQFEKYVRELYALRQRKGVTLAEARRMLLDPTVFAGMMVRQGDADAMVGGIGGHYPDVIRPALQIIQVRPDVSVVTGVHMIVLKDRVLFFADTTVNIDPTAEQLAEIAICTAQVAQRFHVEPRVAMVSFSNFGSVRHPFVTKVRDAVAILKRRAPEMVVDGEMQADTAVAPEIVEQNYPFSALKGGANVLVFPDLQSANAAFKLVQRLAGAEVVGPILTGMRHPVGALQHGLEVKDIVNLTVIAVVEAQANETPAEPQPKKARSTSKTPAHTAH
jgi:malate dehydrogenase (oxaloacetate-decarboxylating)(NADP+)